MKYDFLKDPQTEAWCADLRGERYDRRQTARALLVEAIIMTVITGGIAIGVYLAVNGA